MAERRVISAACDVFFDKRPRLRRAWYALSRDVVVKDGMLEYRVPSTRMRVCGSCHDALRRFEETCPLFDETRAAILFSTARIAKIDRRKSVVYATFHLCLTYSRK